MLKRKLSRFALGYLAYLYAAPLMMLPLLLANHYDVVGLETLFFPVGWMLFMGSALLLGPTLGEVFGVTLALFTLAAFALTYGLDRVVEERGYRPWQVYAGSYAVSFLLLFGAFSLLF